MKTTKTIALLVSILLLSWSVPGWSHAPSVSITEAMAGSTFVPAVRARGKARHVETGPQGNGETRLIHKQTRFNSPQRIIAQNRTTTRIARTKKKKTPEGPTPPGGWKGRDGKNMCWSEIVKKWIPHGGKVTVTGGGKVLRVYQCNDGIWKIVYDSYGDGKSDKDIMITK